MNFHVSPETIAGGHISRKIACAKIVTQNYNGTAEYKSIDMLKLRKQLLMWNAAIFSHFMTTKQQ